MASCLMQEEFELSGADILIDSDVPLGSGLSSSAALEISIGSALITINNHQLNPVDLALIAQRAEQEFTGTKCGVMDQYISCLGVKDHALLIDCRDLSYRAVPLNLQEARVVVCNTMVKHDLAASAYNQRRAECEEGAHLLSHYLPGIESLRDVEIEGFNLYADRLPETIRRRCHHVVTENARVLSSVAALENGDLAQFGRLMKASHESLQYDYEVSCLELDLLVDLATHSRGVFGARMTGGGFGGSTVNLVAKQAVDEFITTIEQNYQKETGMRPETYVCTAVEGVKEETEAASSW
jgi:galactokinase